MAGRGVRSVPGRHEFSSPRADLALCPRTRDFRCVRRFLVSGRGRTVKVWAELWPRSASRTGGQRGPRSGTMGGTMNRRCRWRAVAHHGAFSEGGGGSPSGGFPLIMLGSRVRVPPLLFHRLRRFENRLRRLISRAFWSPRVESVLICEICGRVPPLPSRRSAARDLPQMTQI